MTLNFKQRYRKKRLINKKIDCPLCKKELYNYNSVDPLRYKNIHIGCSSCSFDIHFLSFGKREYYLWSVDYGQYRFRTDENPSKTPFITFPTNLKQFLARMTKLALLGIPA